MNKKIFKSVLMATGIVAMTSGAYAQKAQPVSAAAFSIPVKNGSVAMSLQGKELSQTGLAARLPALLGLSDKHTFVQVTETTDKLGFTHIGYQQYYQGVPIDGSKVLVHFKKGIANNINGKIAQIGTMVTYASISKEEAITYAKSSLGVTKLLNQYPVQLVVAPVAGTAKGKEYALVFKVRIDGRSAEGNIVMNNVFVDASTGKVLSKTELIAHTDVNGTAHTIYSGTRTIVTDSTATGYRLRDNGRKIETYDVGGKDVLDNGTVFFDSPRDYFNTTTDWNEQPALMKMSLTNVTNNMLTGLGFQTGKFVTSIVVKGDMVNNEMVTWPDIKLAPNSTATLPIHSRNIYVFPTDINYSGGFAKIDLFTTQELTDSAFFGLTSIVPGTYPWTDAQGNAGTYEIAQKKNPALDAHWGMEMTHDYYSQVFNRNSYDGNGSVVKNFINGIWPTAFTQNNAAALPAPYFSMVYGLGDGVNMDPVVGLDVMGHEFTHMVTESNGNGGLDYQGESGALNESFSDIFGTCIEFFTKGADANWTMGEGIILNNPGFFRSMSAPKLAQNPDTYGGQYWVNPNNTQNDNGGVHTNSGVQNKWFYLLTEGGTGTNDKGDAYNVTGIGIEKAQNITYRNLITYLTPQSDYMDAYHGSLQAAEDLFGSTTAPEYVAVKAAWFAVGVGEQDSATAINEIAVKENDLQLYPNPATSRVTISSAIDKNIDAQIINVVGVPVMNVKVSKGLNPVDISTLAKGIYMIRYNTGVKGYVQKLSVL